jgi:hypothetical protein
MARPVKNTGTCAARECDRPAQVRGLCFAHYQRPSESAVRYQGRNVGKVCDEVECINPAAVRGKCRLHYNRLRRAERVLEELDRREPSRRRT